MSTLSPDAARIRYQISNDSGELPDVLGVEGVRIVHQTASSSLYGPFQSTIGDGASSVPAARSRSHRR